MQYCGSCFWHQLQGPGALWRGGLPAPFGKEISGRCLPARFALSALLRPCLGSSAREGLNQLLETHILLEIAKPCMTRSRGYHVNNMMSEEAGKFFDRSRADASEYVQVQQTGDSRTPSRSVGGLGGGGGVT